MRIKTFFFGIVIFMAGSCGDNEIKYVVFESDTNSLFEIVEAIDNKLDDLISEGSADEDDLLELKREINNLQNEMQDAFIDEYDVEPSHMRR